MARALLIGCGCRGRELGARLLGDGWQVRGTSRRAAALDGIAGAGIEPALADPERPGTVLALVGDVTVVAWLLACARGPAAELDAIHGPRLERLLEKLVDTPVRGFVYERGSAAADGRLAAGERLVREASARWRIPIGVLDADPAPAGAWTGAALEAVAGALGVPPEPRPRRSPG